jgi:hypothetical protein
VLLPACCAALSAIHLTCSHLRQVVFEHCNIISSGFCGAESMQINRSFYVESVNDSTIVLPEVAGSSSEILTENVLELT